MSQRTVLYSEHQAAGAKLVPFSGWEMPLYYQSQLHEHHAVRQAAGLFDVSHMLAVDLLGKDTLAFLSRILANNPQKLIPGKALYSCLLNEQGGIIDDLIVYQLDEQHYRVVVNAGNRQIDVPWFYHHAQAFNDVAVVPREDLAILALQGPTARVQLLAQLSEPQQTQVRTLKPFHCVEYENLFIARTGYTGEDGVEIMLPQAQAGAMWRSLLAQGVTPCGLGARDTLRLEAGFNLYGTDMDTTTTPLESNLAWTVAWAPQERDFIGRQALERAVPQQKLVGLLLEEKGRILRGGQKVRLSETAYGTITSGSYSPTLERSVAFARIPSDYQDPYCEVLLGNKTLRTRIIPLPFVRKGKKAFS